MRTRLFHLTLLLVAFVTASSGSEGNAQEPLRLKVTIQKVDAFSGAVTLERNKAVREFAFSDDAKISLDGKSVKLSDLKSGLKATILYDSATKSVTAITVEEPSPSDIDVIRSTGPATRVEIKTTARELDSASLTDDGLVIVFSGLDPEDRESYLWMAMRSSPDAEFDRAVEMFPGIDPAIDGRGLALAFYDKAQERVMLATRRRLGEPFATPRPIFAIPRKSGIFAPFIAADGLTLWLDRGPSGLLSSVRESTDEAWPPPKDVQASSSGFRAIRFPATLPSHRQLLVTGITGTPNPPSSALVLTETGIQWTQQSRLQIEGIDRGIIKARYCPATSEVFFTAFTESGKEIWKAPFEGVFSAASN